MKRHVNQPATWAEAFDSVIETYQETKSTNGSIGALDYARAGEAAGGTKNPRMVRPSTSDFIVDVELAARRALPGSSEFSAWLVYYQSLEVPLTKVPKNAITANVREKVGRMLIHRGIFPLASYMKGRDCR